MTNRLAKESSPYLLQHAENPVDWHPWGPEAFAESVRRGVPVFLSVGYSTCHWCHVMARESFEDVETASLLNAQFVCVKVDREERPDVDAAYMAAVQAMTPHGGWPMSVFLTPEGKPFYAGSYWPKDAQDGRPAFADVARAVTRAWEERRGAVMASVEAISAKLAVSRGADSRTEVDPSTADRAASTVLGTLWDRKHGGFGRSPKFPQAMTIEWLLHRFARTADDEALAAGVQALEAMARGGIHDQLDGGFARYCVDDGWLVPHFEKMLYDNALLLPAYAAAAALTGRADLARTARSTAGYLLTELRTSHGAFASATDAESAGVEGGYVVWTHEELTEALVDAGADPGRWAAFLGVTRDGNWEGTNILHEPISRDRVAESLGISSDDFETEWQRIRTSLAIRRQTRTPPRRDDKILTDWNALAIRGLTRAGMLLNEPSWIREAAGVADFLHERLFVEGRLHHVWTNGTASVNGFLLDHVALALADLELFQATGDQSWFERALETATTAHERFHDEGGGWFETEANDRVLYTRPQPIWDDATPCGTSVMVEVCLVLAGLTGDLAWRERAREGIVRLQPDAANNPTRHGWLLRQMESFAARPREVAIIGAPGPERDELVRAAFGRPRPGTVIVLARAGQSLGVPLLAERGEIDGMPAAYVCEDLSCQRPVTSAADLNALLADPSLVP